MVVALSGAERSIVHLGVSPHHRNLSDINNEWAPGARTTGLAGWRFGTCGVQPAFMAGAGGPDRDVVKLHGRRAVASAWDRRPEAVVRVYVDRDARGELGGLLKALAARRVAYRLVDAAELDRVADSRHHEGVCALVRPAPVPSFEAWLGSCGPAALVLALDGVVNPHNLGALVRTAAHFGATGVWTVGEPPRHGACARVAEGGLEHVPLLGTPDLPGILERLAEAGFMVVGAQQDADDGVFGTRLSRRTALVLGSERTGLSAEVASRLEAAVMIPGSGVVESLNVAAAGAVLMGEWYRQRAEAKERGRRA